MENTLGPNEIGFLTSQEQLLENVLNSIRNYISSQKPVDLKAVAKTIEELKEEIQDGRERDLPALYYQLNLQYSLASKLSESGQDYPSCSDPYFGYMKLEEEGKHKVVLLGHRSFIQDREQFRIVDWKKAPIAKVFYQYSEGEEYEFDLRQRTMEGTVLEQCIVTIEEGKLLRVQRGGKTYIKKNSQWLGLDSLAFKLEGGEGSASRELGFGMGMTNFKGPEVVALLDKQQFELINKDFHEPLLIIGGAGSGKTTVALHRVALICQRKKLFPDQVLVLVPNKGLVTLSKSLLHSVGLTKVKVQTNQQWLRTQCRRLVSSLPSKECEETPLAASLIKRHISFLSLMDEFLMKREQQLQEKIMRLWPQANLSSFLKLNKHLPLIPKYEKFISIHVTDSLVSLNLTDEINKLLNYRELLMEMITDKKLLEQLPSKAPNVITQKMISEFSMHTGRQIQEDDEDKSYSENTIDGKSLNYGTSFEVKGTIDQEDYALLLYLVYLLKGEISTKSGQLKRFHHVVLDEVQELSPVELKVFSQCLSERGNMTIAGDSAQQIDKTLSFESWEGVLGHLGASAASPQELTISYRSPRTIVEFSHRALGGLAPQKMPEALREGVPVKVDQAQHRGQISLQIYEALNDLLLREPNASVAIICAQAATARSYYEELKDLEKIRLVENSDFSFRPGIDVTTVEQIRGLEFDYVILPDVNRSSYPGDPRSRKRVHLAATRAIHQLWVLYDNEISPVISL